MRTKRFLTTTAAMLMMLAIIGSGFSYWFFGNQLADEVVTGTVGVTQLIEAGSITAASSFAINFDQTQNGRDTYGNAVDLGDIPSGITLVFTDENKVASYTNTSIEADGADVAFKFSVSIKLPTALADYITVATTNSDWNSAPVVTTDGDNTTLTFSSTSSKTFDWDNVTVTYAEGKEPKNKDEYTAFAAIVDAASVTVTYKAVIGTAAN